VLQEDLILPHHYTFYELILNKARGKSGPLFDFGVKDDIRLMGDANVESQDVHAGKVRRRPHPSTDQPPPPLLAAAMPCCDDERCPVRHVTASR
jgi:hypothetical protein